MPYEALFRGRRLTNQESAKGLPMEAWNATSYLKFAVERTRPAVDLVARIELENPASIADLGCGPGNSTQVLRQRWPAANVVGIDSSPEMISEASRLYPDQQWRLGDISNYRSDTPVTLAFSNAALQWVRDHETLVALIWSYIAAEGVLAFQIPSSTYATIRRLIFEVSEHSIWTSRMENARTALTMESPGFYYDLLAPTATKVDIWETEYIHVMESREQIITWISSTGLKPFLSALDTIEERDLFMDMLRERVASAYALQRDRKVLFPFRRTFVIAYK